MKENYNPVAWFEIYVNDINRATAFYQTVLDVKMNPMLDPTESGAFQMMGFPSEMNAPNATGALVHMKGVQAGGNSTLVYFACENCQTEEDRVVAAGGQVFKPKMSIGEYGFISLCIDTEGNMFGLFSMQ